MKALIIVDVQYDFLPGGALAVPQGDEVVGPARALQERFEHVIATQDWHPRNHGSFASQHPGKRPGEVIELNGISQVLWPDHCVQDTRGAELVSALDSSRISKVFRKGEDPAVDSYSGFYDNGRRHSTGLAEYLKQAKVDAIYVCGLALDYCVKFTALDGAAEGLTTFLIVDACRAVNLAPNDGDRAVEEMKKAGVKLVRARELVG